jgi:hypothetical protein
MGMESKVVIETGIAALVLSAMFIEGKRIHVLRRWASPRGIISMGAGTSIAYVFIYLMPELASARRGFTETIRERLPYQGMVVYFVALIGFLLFYGLDNWCEWLENESRAHRRPEAAFRLHICGFAAYVVLMAYLLTHHFSREEVSLVLYTLAIAFHFLALDRTLRSEHGAAYQRSGHLILAGATAVGWLVGLMVDLPDDVLAMLVAFISGAIIMNSCVMELRTEKEGRFWWFVGGSLGYGLILLQL